MHNRSSTFREPFYGTIANCVKCHGDSALGDGQLTDYDEWAKEFITDGRTEGCFDLCIARPLAAADDRPRNSRSRYFGGLRPIDIYWRIMNGIEGTLMLLLATNIRKPEDPPKPKLNPDEIWDLVTDAVAAIRTD